jgi:arginase
MRLMNEEIQKPTNDSTILNGKNNRTILITGACISEGQDWYEGVDKAPSALKDAGLWKVVESLGYNVIDGGEVSGDSRIKTEDILDPGMYYANEVKNSALLGRALGELHQRVLSNISHNRDAFTLTIGGDHGIAAGTISAIKRAHKDIAVVWVDAHADCNTPETSPSGNFHGMPLGLLFGCFKKKIHPSFDWIEEYMEDPLSDTRVAYIGLRDIGEGEKEYLRTSNALVFTMTDVDRLGISEIMERIIKKFSPDGSRHIHLSFDIDGIDPTFAPGTGTRCKGGLNYREARYICTRLAETGALRSMDLVEVNPAIDTLNKGPEHGDNPLVSPEASQTVKLGIELIEYALGKRYL